MYEMMMAARHCMQRHEFFLDGEIASGKVIVAGPMASCLGQKYFEFAIILSLCRDLSG